MRFIRGSRLPGTSPRGGRKELGQVINDENVEMRFSTRDAVEENQGQLRRGRDGRGSGVSWFFFLLAYAMQIKAGGDRDQV